MATFKAYAEIITPDSLTVKLHEVGIRKPPPGILLQEILQKSGGVYETKIGLSHRLREEIRKVALLTSDDELLRIADLSEVTVSLEHLRSVDPHTTRIACGCSLDYTKEESEQLGLEHKGPYDPSTTVLVDGGTVRRLPPDS